MPMASVLFFELIPWGERLTLRSLSWVGACFYRESCGFNHTEAGLLRLS